MLTEVNKKLFTLQKLKNVGPATLKKLLSSSVFSSASISYLATINTKLGKALEDTSAWDVALGLAERDLESAYKSGVRIISILDDEYPSLLKQTPDCPVFLYVKGQWASDSRRSVAVIGTRSPTEHGAIIAKRTTSFLVEDGWSIVSGLAIGCDALAHQAALDAGGHTVAVLAHGLHTIAPKQHERLAKQILENGGTLVTQFQFGEDPVPRNFAIRDRIQAGLARGVVMIQSDLEGGSMHASRAAIDYGRCLAVPFPTERDLTAKEKKIEANCILTGDQDQEKIALLKCGRSDLNNIFVIRGKDDYSSLSRFLVG